MAMDDSTSSSRLNDKTWVPLGLSVALAAGAIALASNWTTRFVRVESTLESVVSELRKMNENMTSIEDNALSKAEFAAFVAVLEARNPTMVFPAVPR